MEPINITIIRIIIATNQEVIFVEHYYGFVFCSHNHSSINLKVMIVSFDFIIFLISSPGMIRGERLGSVLLFLKIIFQKLAPVVFY